MKEFYLTMGVVLTVCSAGWSFSGSGAGTEIDAYVITNVYQLQEMRHELDAHYVLANDIDASDTVYWNSGQGFYPICAWEEKVFVPFTGTFNGQGHTITGLFIDRSSDTSTPVGLFGGIGTGSVIKNINLDSVKITGYKEVGAVVGSHKDGTVSACHVSGQVECTYWYGGGVIGNMSEPGQAINCSSTCSVSGYRYTGGFAGIIQGTAIECSSSGDVSGSYGYTGGFAGNTSYGTITKCYARGNVNSTISNAGGFIGATIGSDYLIDQCYSTGNVVSGSRDTGGFIGGNTTGVVKNCYSTGSARGTFYIGGFAGINHGTLRNCYSIGAVSSTTGDSRTGGFCGVNDDGTVGTISSCYYDTQTSGLSDTGKGIPKSTVEMMYQITFQGWDFDTIWYVNSGNDYPELRWTIPMPSEPVTWFIDGIDGSNANDGLTKETAFAAIQTGIYAAKNGDTVVVGPGTYNETVDFLGKAITVRSSGDAAVITNPAGYGVRFHTAEGADSVLKNMVVRNCIIGVQAENASPTLDHLTVVNNTQGIAADASAYPDIANSIFWNNSSGDLVNCTAANSWVQSQIVVTDGLVAQYSFEGNPRDTSGYGNHGTEHGGVSYVSGVSGLAGSFDGIDDFISTNSNPLSGGYPYTVTCWVKSTIDVDTAVNPIVSITSWNNNGSKYFHSLTGLFFVEPLIEFVFGGGKVGQPEDLMTQI